MEQKLRVGLVGSTEKKSDGYEQLFKTMFSWPKQFLFCLKKHYKVLTKKLPIFYIYIYFFLFGLK